MHGFSAFKFFHSEISIKSEIKSFDDIFNAISRIQDTPLDGKNSIKGVLFEVFVHAMLFTDPVYNVRYAFKPGDASEASDIKSTVLKRLNIKDEDNGIDLVLVDGNDRVIAVQDKFLSDTKGSVSFSGLSTFYSQSKNADVEIIVTTGANIDKQNKDPDSKPRIKLTYDDLSALSPERIRDILEYIRLGDRKLITRKTPRPDQVEALKNLEYGVDHLGDRIQYISACGTGKTFVSSRFIRERYEDIGGNIVVFVPSLNLMKQTVEAWAEEMSDLNHYSFQAICSDPTTIDGGLRIVGENADIHVDDLKFATSTNVADIRTFLNKQPKKNELKVTFCTYQSSPVLAEAIAASEIKAFDIGLFDEAHRTAVAGDVEAVNQSAFTLPLNDENIPILKRLFMTATPRIRNSAKSEKTDQEIYSYSMDNQEIYGPVAHEYKFAKAVADKVIVPFKIILSVVYDDDVKQIQRSYLETTNLALDDKSAIKVVALKKATEMSGATNIITYQGRTLDAKNMAKVLGDIMPSGWSVDHVNGTMKTKERARRVSILGTDKPAIVTNSKVLTEGVDIPRVDMAAFIDNVSSEVDIVQAVGRVMRTASGKECGYVTLPVHVTLKSGQIADDDIIESKTLSTMAKVISALMSEDENLACALREVRAARGSKDDERQNTANQNLRKIISFAGSKAGLYEKQLISEEFLFNMIETRIVDRLTSSFWARYEEVAEYVKKNGAIPNQYSDDKFADGTLIGGWCKVQKARYKKGIMSNDEVKFLESIGFVWSDVKIKISMGEKLKTIEKYVNLNGHFPPQGGSDRFNDGTLMGNLCAKIREGRIKLSDQNVAKLKELGFQWRIKARATSTDDKIKELSVFFKDKGRIPDSSDNFMFKGGGSAYKWYSKLRAMRGSLTPEQVADLNAMGFIWRIKNRSNSTIDDKIRQIAKYKEMHGTFPKRNLSIPFDGEFTCMGTWCDAMRQKRKTGKLSRDHIQALDIIGFQWTIFRPRQQRGHVQ